MGSKSYTPRHGARHAARATPHTPAALAAVRRPVIGGAIAVAMLGSIGATVAMGDPGHAGRAATAALGAAADGRQESAPDSTTQSSGRAGADTARLAERRRSAHVSRSASRESARREAARKKRAKEERAEEKARQRREAAKPVSERDFTDAEIQQIQADPKPYAIELMREYGWDDSQWGCLEQLWIGESDWEWNATNSTSGAYGIPQALPASKMASAGGDWRTNPVTQIEWGLNYIQLSYGSPCGALDFWNAQNPHWY